MYSNGEGNKRTRVDIQLEFRESRSLVDGIRDV